MTDYKKYADIMESNSVGENWISAQKFKALCNSRNFKYVTTIDGDVVERREVWGNRNFQIIVKHDCFTNEYWIL